jgi:LysM repeat protein
MLCGTLLMLAATTGWASSLVGSLDSVKLQYRMASLHDYSMLRDAAEVRRFVAMGLLVPMHGNAHYEVSGVSFPYARAETRLFIERLADQYHDACGEPLVVTSLTRPLSHQPRNSSRYSVHPTGMAVDLRKSRRRSCRTWLEKTLLTLENHGVLDATLERKPPHYHISVFSRPYARYVAQKAGDLPLITYEVQHGDTLWDIAREHSTSVGTIQELNDLPNPVIYPGQTLKVPVR